MRFRNLFPIIVLFASSAGAQDFTIVIDPGHGGKDSGAPGARVLEKTLNLAIARRFGGLIEERLPDVRVIYTRSDDRFIELAERGAIANRAGADLFFSIHINSAKTATANGSSTFVLGTSKNEQSLREVMRENEVIKLEEDYGESYDGFDPSSAESYIIFNLMQYAHFDHSLALAKIVQKHYTAVTPLRDRGAAQGPYLVLWKAAMPAVLTEVGFIRNPADVAYISSEKGQDEVARCLYDAFCEYRALLAGQGVVVRQAHRSEQIPERVEGPERIELTVEAPREGYYVQLFASREHVRGLGGDVVERRVDGWYKYCTGPYATEREALRARDAARRGKYKDAFITK